MVITENFTRVALRFERLDGSWQPVSAILEPKQTFNLISDSLVSELDLLSMVEEYTGEDCDIWVESPSGGRIRPTGRITIKFWSGLSHVRPIPLLF